MPLLLQMLSAVLRVVLSFPASPFDSQLFLRCCAGAAASQEELFAALNLVGPDSQSQALRGRPNMAVSASVRSCVCDPECMSRYFLPLSLHRLLDMLNSGSMCCGLRVLCRADLQARHAALQRSHEHALGELAESRRSCAHWRDRAEALQR